MAKDQKTTQDQKSNSQQQTQSEQTAKEQASSEQTSDQSAEQVQASTPDPGNPYTVSADGRGSVYNPAVDGAPGKEAEAKQRKADQAK